MLANLIIAAKGRAYKGGAISPFLHGEGAISADGGETDSGDSDSSDGGVQTVTREKVRVKKPKLYKVFLLNDDYTTMDFVVSILERVFQKSPSEATRVMLQVHQQGSGLCGTYPKEIAEAKVQTVEVEAAKADFPLKCTMEEE
ncbi:ATP-dependent Clp protease adapter ClpS [bacterium]|nr:ATP-dependent Clp protease adapter ClpS [bacterium]